MTKFLEMDIQRFAGGLDFPTTFTIHCYGETSRGIFEEFDTDTETKDFLNLGSQYTWSPKLKDGYVFCRLGEEAGDIEFRNRTKLPELMKNFEFIKELNRSLNEELKEEEEEEFE